jgi:hypothetical protein
MTHDAVRCARTTLIEHRSHTRTTGKVSAMSRAIFLSRVTLAPTGATQRPIAKRTRTRALNRRAYSCGATRVLHTDDHSNTEGVPLTSGLAMPPHEAHTHPRPVPMISVCQKLSGILRSTGHGQPPPRPCTRPSPAALHRESSTHTHDEAIATRRGAKSGRGTRCHPAPKHPSSETILREQNNRMFLVSGFR